LNQFIIGEEKYLIYHLWWKNEIGKKDGQKYVDLSIFFLLKDVNKISKTDK
jgi:hypothetical protein